MDRYRHQQRKTVAIMVGALVLIVGLVIGLAVIVMVSRPDPSTTQPVTYDSYQEAWESAMAKASVEASFPAEPIPLAGIEASGTHEFSALFTAEELAALMTMHSYDYPVDGGTVSLTRPALDFGVAGRAGLTGRLVYDGSGYKTETEAAVTFENGHVVIEPDDASLTVSGFSVGGDKRKQALDTMGDYLDALLTAAPGLTIKNAEIVEGGVFVEGIAPASIKLPRLLP